MNAKEILSAIKPSVDNLQLLRGNFTPLSYIGDLANPKAVIISKQENLKEITIPKEWKNLEYLNLCDNKNLQGLTIEAPLSKLAHLDCSDCQLQTIELSGDFSQLKDLYLQGNQLTQVDLSGDFSSLRLLDLSKNPKLRNLPSTLASFESLQYLYTYESPILVGEENLAQQTGNAWRKISTFLSALDQGKKKNYRTKLIVVGNGRVGKTSMLKVMQGGDCDPKEKYTHGISLGEIKNKDLANLLDKDFSAQVWDFGGQEIFYATHQFFMRDNALYVLAWTCPSIVEKYRKDMLMNNKTIDVSEKWKAEQAWLENIRAYTETAPILMVQTHYGDSKLTENPAFGAGKYQAEINHRINSMKKRGFEDLKEAIAEKLKTLPTYGQDYPISYDKVVRAIAEEDNPWISKERFYEICDKAKIEKGSEDVVLEYLNNTGVCIHYPNIAALSSKVYIDPSWLTQCVYALLNKQLKEENGEMNDAYINARLLELKAAKNIEIPQQELIELLKNFQLIFETEERREETGQSEKVFIYPEYLPEQLDKKQQVYHNRIKKDLTLAFVLRFTNYLPENVLINIICYYGPDTTNDIVWKNGIYFTTTREEEAIIEFDEKDGYFYVYTRKETENLQREICYKFEELGRNTAMEIALDISEGFLPWAKLTNDRIMADFLASERPAKFTIRNKENRAFNYGDWVHLVSGQMFHRQKMKEVAAIPSKVKETKVYFSYAWGDDKEQGESREAIVNEMYAVLKADGFQVMRDKEEIKYGALLSEFMKDVGAGKLVLVFISERYFESVNCMFELLEIARTSELDKEKFRKRILLIPVNFLNFKKINIWKKYINYWREVEAEWEEIKNDQDADIPQMEEYQKRKEIRQNFGKLSGWIADIQQSSTKELSKDNFELIKQAIIQRLEN